VGGGDNKPTTTSGVGGGDNKPTTTSGVGGGDNKPTTTSGVGGGDNKRTTTSGCGVDWTAVGNPFLLDAPLLVSVRVSTAVPAEELSRVVARVCEKASRGAVVVSPFISPGEKTVRAAVLDNGGSVVQLMAEGFGRYYKPGGRDFDLCAQGRLLQLSPFQPRQAGATEREHFGKARFEWLNLAAANIADLPIGWSRPR